MSKHTPAPWDTDIEDDLKIIAKDGGIARVIARVNWGRNDATDVANARLIAAAPELAAYARCEEARARGEDIAETVLRREGWNPSQCTAVQFVDGLRRAALAKVEGK